MKKRKLHLATETIHPLDATAAVEPNPPSVRGECDATTSALATCWSLCWSCALPFSCVK